MAYQSIHIGTKIDEGVTRAIELPSSDTGKGASQVGIEDVDGNYAATNVEDALNESAERISNLKLEMTAYGEYCLGSAQSVAVTSPVQIVLNTTVKASNLFTLESGFVKVLQAGVYEIIGQVAYAGATVDFMVSCGINVDGVSIGATVVRSLENTGYTEQVQAKALATLSANQTIGLYARKSSTTARNVSATSTKIWVRKVG